MLSPPLDDGDFAWGEDDFRVGLAVLDDFDDGGAWLEVPGGIEDPDGEVAVVAPAEVAADGGDDLVVADGAAPAEFAEAEGEGAENSEKVKTFTANLGKGDANAITKSGKKAREYAASLTDVPEDIKAALEGHAIGIYQFEILIPEDVVEISLSGGKGKGNFTELIYDKEAPNGNEFFALEGDANDGILYFGKSNWINSYNNGAIFLISGKKMDSMGAPLPTPVVTLLIALGFGAAFVMYRNRKQVKA